MPRAPPLGASSISSGHCPTGDEPSWLLLHYLVPARALIAGLQHVLQQDLAHLQISLSRVATPMHAVPQLIAALPALAHASVHVQAVAHCSELGLSSHVFSGWLPTTTR